MTIPSLKRFVPVILLASCTTAHSQDLSLKLAWQAGPATRHTVSLEMDLQTNFEDDKGQQKSQNKVSSYGATYEQIITSHDQGLLVSQSNVQVNDPPASIGDVKASTMQLALLKLTSLAIAARPDYIISVDGDFIGFQDFA